MGKRARQDGRPQAKIDLWPAPDVALAKDQGRRLHLARTGGRACRTWSESGLPDRLELRPRRETQFQKKAWWPASATVPTSYGGAHSGGSIKTRSSPSVSSSSMRLGPRPTWHHCVDGGRGAEGSKPKSRTVTGTRRVLAALRLDRIEAPWLLEGPINGETFQVYVERVLVPTLRPGDIVIMDNLGSHKGKAVRRLIRAAGAKLFFLPRYSP